MALSGDLYGDARHPISSGTTIDEQQQRFLAGFRSLQTGGSVELVDILTVMRAEMDNLYHGMIDGVWGDGAYDRENFDSDYNSATAAEHWNDIISHRYLDLALKNYDHFGADAQTA